MRQKFSNGVQILSLVGPFLLTAVLVLGAYYLMFSQVPSQPNWRPRPVAEESEPAELTLVALTEEVQAQTEAEWAARLAPKYGTPEAFIEYRLWDRTRVDLLPQEGEFAAYAIEIDFARKWQEAISQAGWYAKVTGRQPGVILIVEGELEQEARFVYRCQTVCALYGVRLWVEK